MRRRTTRAALAGTLAPSLALLGPLWLGACSGEGTDATATTAATTEPPAFAADALPPDRVVIADFTFVRPVTSVPAGTTVTWENADGAGHTVTGAGGIFDSGRLEPGARFTRTFDTPGEFAYFCSIHTDMTAKIVVAA
jgi:plastocyanin